MATLDAVATDAQGRPVAGLGAGDFELTQAGDAQKIADVTWFDNGSQGRSLVLIVDDLGLAPDDVKALQVQLRAFAGQLAPGDRAALVRTSSGAGWRQQLSADRRAFHEQIEHILPLGRGMSNTAIAGAIWQTIRWVADGLRTVPGRKSVVLISERLDARLISGDDQVARTSITAAANAATMVFYTVDPRGPAEPPPNSSLASLVTVTGGLAAADLAGVLRDQGGYYVIGFHPTQEAKASIPGVLNLRGKVLHLRWRFGFLSHPAPTFSTAPPDRTTAVQRELAGATGGAEIRTRVTPLFNGFTGAGANVDVLVHVDARDLSVVRDLKGMHELSAEVQVSYHGDSGRVISPPGRTLTVTMTDAGYEKARKDGLVYTTRATLPAAGGYQVRAAVADVHADRFGTAMQFLEIPDVNKGRFGLTGLVVKNPDPAVEAQYDSFAVRVFQRGAPIGFGYGVFNATVGSEKKSRIRSVTRIYATGRMVYEGQPVDLEFQTTMGTVSGKVQPGSGFSAGEYVLEVEVTDMLAKTGSPRVAFQYMTFEVRE